MAEEAMAVMSEEQLAQSCARLESRMRMLSTFLDDLENEKSTLLRQQGLLRDRILSVQEVLQSAEQASLRPERLVVHGRDSGLELTWSFQGRAARFEVQQLSQGSGRLRARLLQCEALPGEAQRCALEAAPSKAYVFHVRAQAGGRWSEFSEPALWGDAELILQRSSEAKAEAPEVPREGSALDHSVAEVAVTDACATDPAVVKAAVPAALVADAIVMDKAALTEAADMAIPEPAVAEVADTVAADPASTDTFAPDAVPSSPDAKAPAGTVYDVPAACATAADEVAEVPGAEAADTAALDAALAEAAAERDAARSSAAAAEGAAAAAKAEAERATRSEMHAEEALQAARLGELAVQEDLQEAQRLAARLRDASAAAEAAGALAAAQAQRATAEARQAELGAEEERCSRARLEHTEAMLRVELGEAAQQRQQMGQEMAALRATEQQQQQAFSESLAHLREEAQAPLEALEARCRELEEQRQSLEASEARQRSEIKARDEEWQRRVTEQQARLRSELELWRREQQQTLDAQVERVKLEQKELAERAIRNCELQCQEELEHTRQAAKAAQAAEVRPVVETVVEIVEPTMLKPPDAGSRLAASITPGAWSGAERPENPMNKWMNKILESGPQAPSAQPSLQPSQPTHRPSMQPSMQPPDVSSLGAYAGAPVPEAISQPKAQHALQAPHAPHAQHAQLTAPVSAPQTMPIYRSDAPSAPSARPGWSVPATWEPRAAGAGAVAAHAPDTLGPTVMELPRQHLEFGRREMAPPDMATTRVVEERVVVNMGRLQLPQARSAISSPLSVGSPERMRAGWRETAELPPPPRSAPARELPKERREERREAVRDGRTYVLTVLTSESRWETLTFSQAQNLEQQALDFLSQKRLKAAFSAGLTAKMRDMVAQGLSRSSVDIVDLI